MDDLIRRQAAIEAIQKLYPGIPKIDVGDRWFRWRKENNQYIECEEAIKKLPSIKLKIECEEDIKDLSSAQPERPKGEWKTEWHYFFHVDLPICSYCLQFSPFKYDFCPRCGADMRKVGTPNESKNTRSLDNL